VVSVLALGLTGFSNKKARPWLGGLGFYSMVLRKKSVKTLKQTITRQTNATNATRRQLRVECGLINSFSIFFQGKARCAVIN
jgi:hypothetical protein